MDFNYKPLYHPTCPQCGGSGRVKKRWHRVLIPVPELTPRDVQLMTLSVDARRMHKSDQPLGGTMPHPFRGERRNRDLVRLGRQPEPL